MENITLNLSNIDVTAIEETYSYTDIINIYCNNHAQMLVESLEWFWYLFWIISFLRIIEMFFEKRFRYDFTETIYFEYYLIKDTRKILIGAILIRFFLLYAFNSKILGV